jgi:3-methyladenine DNA glycosylase AlkD
VADAAPTESSHPPLPTPDSLDQALRDHADPVRAAKEKQYLKSDLNHYGVGVPTMHRLAAVAAKPFDRESLLDVATDLWDEPTEAPVFERRFLAADLLSNRTELLTPNDLPLVERLCREARTWAIIDTLAPRVVGPMATRYPDELTPVLDSWAIDPDHWMRRTALLAHLIPLRDGRGDWPRFTRYADALLDDREFFVAKAIGWVLRDTGRRRPEMVLEWVEPRYASMTAVTAREAVKPFSADEQVHLKALRSSIRAPRDRPQP